MVTVPERTSPKAPPRVHGRPGRCPSVFSAPPMRFLAGKAFRVSLLFNPRQSASLFGRPPVRSAYMGGVPLYRLPQESRQAAPCLTGRSPRPLRIGSRAADRRQASCVSPRNPRGQRPAILRQLSGSRSGTDAGHGNPRNWNDRRQGFSPRPEAHASTAAGHSRSV